MHAIFYTFLALILLTDGGNRACRCLFFWTSLKDSIADDKSSPYKAGRIIGGLERLILAIGIITHSWEVLAAVIALKTVSRFKDLDEKPFAEYFLVGSLFSILWAVFVTSAWLVYDHRYGDNLHTSIVALIEQPTGQPTN